MTSNPHEGFVAVPGGKVYWCSIGREGRTPLLTLHGGPGFAHDLLVEPFRTLADQRKIYFYDQLGAGRSDRPSDLNLWTRPARLSHAKDSVHESF